jgi:hypothetical protein
MFASVLTAVRPAFRAIATAIVPDVQRLDEPAWIELEAIVSEALALRPVRLQRQLLTFIRLVEWMPVVRFGRRFSQLDAERRTRVLESLQDAPVLLIRRGVWGLRTLILMGHYGRAAVQRAIGYRGDPRGWGARR